ncbi:MAG: 3-dehydroquinate synthase II [Candidatus Marsarchaeota archaeon]|jgi:3-dehydroquinate synthase II|nr:3-dehydroquinate synthase II [Candidatus Marsarchaeota archaeon]
MKEIIIIAKDDKAKKHAAMLGLKALDAMPRTVRITTKADEDKASAIALGEGKVYIQCDDWKVIPLENMIARCNGRGRIIVVVRNVQEARLALETMEVGADGIALATESEAEIEKMAGFAQEIESSVRVPLVEAAVTRVEQLRTGERACIDTSTRMRRGEGMLVGSSSQGMILVQAEVEENALAAPRPFRVNAGAISLYILLPDNKTVYLEELHAGKETLIVAKDGTAKPATIVRSKIEVRPLVLVEAKGKDGSTAIAILQNAETIRIVTPTRSVPVTELKPGDVVLAHFEEGGRHFGTLLKEETVIEK